MDELQADLKHIPPWAWVGVGGGVLLLLLLRGHAASTAAGTSTAAVLPAVAGGPDTSGVAPDLTSLPGAPVVPVPTPTTPAAAPGNGLTYAQWFRLGAPGDAPVPENNQQTSDAVYATGARFRDYLLTGAGFNQNDPGYQQWLQEGFGFFNGNTVNGLTRAQWEAQGAQYLGAASGQVAPVVGTTGDAATEAQLGGTFTSIPAPATARAGGGGGDPRRGALLNALRAGRAAQDANAHALDERLFHHLGML